MRVLRCVYDTWLLPDIQQSTSIFTRFATHEFTFWCLFMSFYATKSLWILFYFISFFLVFSVADAVISRLLKFDYPFILSEKNKRKKMFSLLTLDCSKTVIHNFYVIFFLLSREYTSSVKIRELKYWGPLSNKQKK